MQNSQKLLVEKREEIKKILEDFSIQYLNEDYLKMSVRLCDNLFNAHEEILLKGKSASWACGIIHAIGTEKNLFNKNNDPYIKAGELYKILGVSSSTGVSKSKEIKSLMDNVCVEVTPDSKTKIELKEEDIINKVKKDENFISAQVLIREALQYKNYNKKLKYAKMALEICDYCSDAYIILSNNNKISNDEKKYLLEKAVNASLKLLGLNSLKEVPESMWSRPEIEPLLGAKYKLASQLWNSGDKENAIKELSQILEHDTNDKLMIRSILINWLLMENKLDDAEKLLTRFEKDHLTSINYSKVVLAYKNGDIEAAKKLLHKAYRVNNNVIPYIIKQKRVPSELPHITRFGSEEEAIHYIRNGLKVWNDTSGIIEWIKEEKKSL